MSVDEDEFEALRIFRQNELEVLKKKLLAASYRKGGSDVCHLFDELDKDKSGRYLAQFSEPPYSRIYTIDEVILQALLI